MKRVDLLARVERAYWRRLFRMHGGNIRAICTEAGCCRATVYKRLIRLDIDLLATPKYKAGPLTLAGAAEFLRFPARAGATRAKLESDP
jgi:hypothetical protein